MSCKLFIGFFFIITTLRHKIYKVCESDESMRKILCVLGMFFFSFLLTMIEGHIGICHEENTADLPSRNAIYNVVANGGKVGEEEQVAAVFGWYELHMNAENFVAEELYRCAPEDTKEESLKALAVLLRTEEKKTHEKHRLAEGVINDKNKWERCQNAAKATEGLILTFEGKPIEVLWHYMSGGMTRDGEENCLTAVPYYKVRICKKDILKKSYSQKLIYDKRRFAQILQKELNLRGALPEDAFGFYEIQSVKDQAGYVKYVVCGTEQIDGGQFADAFGLPSPAFDISFEEQNVCFQVKGEGHGFGMSLCGADELAEEGKDFMQILAYFYPGTELGK